MGTLSKQQRVILAGIVLFLVVGLGLAAYLAGNITRPTPRAAAEAVTFTLSPSNPNPDPGELISVALFAAPPAASSAQVRTLSAYIGYNDPIKVASVEASSAEPFDRWDYIKVRDNPTHSRVEILAAYKPLSTAPDPAGYLSGDAASLLATINLTWGDPQQAQQTPGTLSFITDPATTAAKDPDGNDYGISANSIVIPSLDTTPPATPSATISPTLIPPPGATEAALLNFSLTFQGVTPQTIARERAAGMPDPRTQNVRLKLINPLKGISRTLSEIPVEYAETTSSAGLAVYRGNARFNNIVPGSGYLLFIKGPRHLQTLYCENQQTSRCVGRFGENLTILTPPQSLPLPTIITQAPAETASTPVFINSFDFTGHPLEAGDLPDPNENMTRDGVADARDWELIRTLRALHPDDQTAQDLVVADLDLNGRVDTRDAGLLSITLSRRFEQDELEQFGIIQ